MDFRLALLLLAIALTRFTGATEQRMATVSSEKY
jgi:hypothetical protein